MASNVETLMLRMEANLKSVEKELARGTKKIDSTLNQWEQRADKFSNNFNNKLGNIRGGVSSVVTALKPLAPAMASAFSVQALLNYSEKWSEIRNLIAGAGVPAASIRNIMDDLAKIAIATNAPLRETSELYAGLARSTKEFGANQAQIKRVTELINKAGAIGGSSPAAMAGAMIQLQQAFDMGTLRGQELNSILQGMPVLAGAIAKEFGVSVGQLKEMGAKGQLVSDRVFTAILKAGKDIDTQFATTSRTLGQSFTNLNTALTQYFGNLDQGYGITSRMADGVQYLADNLDSVVRIAATLGVSLINPLAGAAAAALLLGDNIQPIAGEIATLADYMRAAMGIIGESFTSASQSAYDMVTGVLQGLSEIVTGSSVSAQDITNVFKGLGNFIIATFVMAVGTVKTAFTELPDAIGSAVVTAMNSMVATVERALNAVVAAINNVIQGMNAVGSYVGATMSEMAQVQLGRFENQWAGAGQQAAQSFGQAFDAYSQDWLGAAFQNVRTKANNLASSREVQNAVKTIMQVFDPVDNLNQSLTPTQLSGSGKGKGGGGGGQKTNDFQKEIENIYKKIAANDLEAQSLGKSAAEALKAKTAHDLLNAAKKSGIPITDELRAKIDGIADAYASSSEQLKHAKEAQEGWKEIQQEIGNSLVGYLSDVVSGGENAEKALMNLTKRLAEMAFQAAILGQGPLAKLFNLSGSGGLLGSLFNFGARASGGPVQAGKPYLVGEHGPEIATFGANGTITPASMVKPKQMSSSSNFTNAPTYNIMPAEGVTPAQLQAVLARHDVQLRRNIGSIVAQNNRRFA